MKDVRTANHPERHTKKSASAARVLSLLLTVASLAYASTRIDLLPKLQGGEILNYAITYHSDKQTKTKSPMALATSPGEVNADIRALLRLEILEVTLQRDRPVIHARATLQSRASAPDAATSSASAAPVVELTILSSGRLDNITGLDALPPELQQAWQQWAARFAAPAIFPQGGIKRGQKWKSVESEQSPSPIAGLAWIRESTYVRNEPCRPLSTNPQGDLIESTRSPDTCAVILITAALKQQSKPKDATPEDYRVRQLRTTGTARGNNKTILYISLTTGLLVRASDEADQSMSVTIAKADGSNHLHYDVDAKSAAEVLLVVAPASSPQNP
jgi:hypothetical protein